jgi:large subunit ribosomal protein L21
MLDERVRLLRGISTSILTENLQASPGSQLSKRAFSFQPYPNFFSLRRFYACKILLSLHFVQPFFNRKYFMAYAVIQTGGKQYRVESGNEIEVEKLDVEPGAALEISEVLLVSDGGNLHLGAPFVDGATVKVTVVDQFKDDKVIAFKFRRRKGYHRTVGHRRRLTTLKIESISTK